MNTPETNQPEYANDEKFLKINETLNEKYDIQGEGLQTQRIYEIYVSARQRSGEKTTDEELIEAIRIEVSFEQINKYTNGEKAASQLGEGALEEFNQNMRKLESIDVLAALGGQTEAVEKLKKGFEGSNFDYGEIIYNLTSPIDNPTTYENYLQMMASIEKDDMKDTIIKKLENLARKLQNGFSIALFELKGLSISKLEKLLVDLQQKIQEAIKPNEFSPMELTLLAVA